MCLILFASGAHPRYPLIVAANRDESYSRPSAPAAVWPDHPEVFGGRDLEHGGTWLAIARNGRFAAITNYRQGHGRRSSERSRGALTRDFLIGGEKPSAYLAGVASAAAEYNGFSLLVGAPGDLWFYSNRGMPPRRVACGVHGLSNHLLDEPWPKVRRGIAELESLLEADEAELTARLLKLLGDREPAPDHLLPATGIALERERALSASFIEGEAYGTRASTVVLVAADGETLFVERTFGAGGVQTGETRQRLRIAMPQSPASPCSASVSSMAR